MLCKCILSGGTLSHQIIQGIEAQWAGSNFRPTHFDQASDAFFDASSFLRF
jgi:hypothetical protein